MRSIWRIGVGTVLVVVSGCTSEQLYDFGNEAGRNQARCNELTSVDEQLRCEERFAKDYEQYKAEREALSAEPDAVVNDA